MHTEFEASMGQFGPLLKKPKEQKEEKKEKEEDKEKEGEEEERILSTSSITLK